MRLTLFRKLLRDVRVGLIVTALLLAAFQCLWAKITSRILGELSPFFTQLASFGGKSITDIQDQIFQGPGQIVPHSFRRRANQSGTRDGYVVNRLRPSAGANDLLHLGRRQGVGGASGRTRPRHDGTSLGPAVVALAA